MHEAVAGKSTKHKAVIMLSILSGVFLAALDNTIVSTALPKIVASLSGVELFSWVISSYLLTTTATVIIYGKLSDIYGRKKMFLLGIIIFLAGSVLSGLSQDIIELIIFRAIQGIGGGAIMVTAFTIIADIFPPAERGRWQGVISVTFGLAAVMGPLLGGFITDAISWHWIFFINIPIGILTMAALSKFLPNVRHRGGPIDYKGSFFLVAAITSLMLGLFIGGIYFVWISLPVLALFAISAAMLFIFVGVEKKADDPVLSPSMFRNRILLVSVSVMFLTTMTFFAVTIFIPLFLQAVMGHSATSSGIMMLPMVFTNVLSSAVAGQLISRTGKYKAIGIAGIFIAFIGMCMLSFISADSLLLMAGIALFGAGLGVLPPVLVISVQSSVEYSRIGTATASLQFFRNMGGLLGISIFGSIMIYLILGNPLAAGLRPGDLQLLLNTGDMTGLAAQNALALKAALTSSLGYIFAVSAVIMLASLALAFFLKEIPLRKSHKA